MQEVSLPGRWRSRPGFGPSSGRKNALPGVAAPDRAEKNQPQKPASHLDFITVRAGNQGRIIMKVDNLPGIPSSRRRFHDDNC